MSGDLAAALEVGPAQGHDLGPGRVAEEGRDPAQGAPEADLAAFDPAHRLLEGELVDPDRDPLGQDLEGAEALDLAAGPQDLAGLALLGHLAELELVHAEAEGLGELGRRDRGLAVLEGGGLGRPALLFDAVGLALGEAGYVDREAAGGPRQLDLGGRERGLLQVALGLLLEGLEGGLNEAGWELFGRELEEQIRHWPPPRRS